MANPRDQKPQWGVPVNQWTGFPITESQQMVLDRLRAAVGELEQVLHLIDGSDPSGPSFGSRRTSIAGTHLEELELISIREILAR